LFFSARVRPNNTVARLATMTEAPPDLLGHFTDRDMAILWEKLQTASRKNDFAVVLSAISHACKLWKEKGTFTNLGDALRCMDDAFRAKNMKIWVSSVPAEMRNEGRAARFGRIVCRDLFTGEDKPLAVFVTTDEAEAMAAPMPRAELRRRFDDTGFYVAVDL